MKTAGIVLLVIGAVGTLVFGYQAMQDSKSVELLGKDITISTANWTPVIISVLLLMVGLVMTSRGRK
jgi:uncharacterized membrane protein YidH (DUF202 family)